MKPQRNNRKPNPNQRIQKTSAEFAEKWFFLDWLCWINKSRSTDIIAKVALLEKQSLKQFQRYRGLLVEETLKSISLLKWPVRPAKWFFRLSERERKRERDRERDRERQTETERDRERESQLTAWIKCGTFKISSNIGFSSNLSASSLLLFSFLFSTLVFYWYFSKYTVHV